MVTASVRVFPVPRTPIATASVVTRRPRRFDVIENELYPAYFDGDLTRSEGRRVPEGMAVEDPTVEAIAKAVQQVGYDAKIERDVAYSREHWRSRGRVLVKNAEDASKNDIVQAVGAYVDALRS
jgi:signal recognition particle subunit SRP19